MSSRQGTYAAIDVGSTKVCTIVGEVAPSGETRVLGVGIAPSFGLGRGSVDNVREASEAIRASVDKAERSSGTRILSALVGLSGAQAESVNNRGVAAIPDPSRAISGEDIRRALEGAQIISVPTNRQILHVLPRYYIVDSQDHVSDPMGMYGQRLDVEAHIITVPRNTVANLTKVIESAGVQVDELVLQPLAGAAAVLSKEEKRHGVILADIGGGHTEVSIFIEGSINHTGTVAMGGNSITNDLVQGLRSPFVSAEKAKELYGHALPSAVEDEEDVVIASFGADGERSYPRYLVSEIIQARAEEILEKIVEEAGSHTHPALIAAGLVLTGGSARLPGLDRLAEQFTGLPARVGLPTEITGLVDELHDPAYATSVGLLRWALGEQELMPIHQQPRPPGALDGIFKRISGLVRVLLPE